ncbi:response regulator [Chitinophaga sp. MM2321]|uniref:response regulator n=1 Tax=Chitinophaga sp. MM2321 TaxID=3137178 RepID=UPI0032D573DE
MLHYLTILLIDDDRNSRNQFFLALDLLKVNKACICFDNHIDAMSYAAEQQIKPDYIFLKTIKPVSNGKQGLDDVKNAPCMEHVPVILYATSFDPNDLVQVKHLGAADWLVKQSDLHILKNALKSIFIPNRTLAAHRKRKRAMVHKSSNGHSNKDKQTGLPV